MILLCKYFLNNDVTTSVAVSGLFFYAYCTYFRHEFIRVLEMWIKLWHSGSNNCPPCIKLPLIKVVGMEMNKPGFVKIYTKLVVCYEKRRRKLQVIQEQRTEQARKCIEMNDREIEEKTKSYGNSDHSTLSDALVHEALKSCGRIPSLSIKRKTRSALAVYRLGRLRRTFLNMLGVGTLLAGVILALYYDIIPSSTCVHGRTYGWDDDSARASYMPNERVVTAIENPSGYRVSQRFSD